MRKSNFVKLLLVLGTLLLIMHLFLIIKHMTAGNTIVYSAILKLIKKYEKMFLSVRKIRKYFKRT